MEIEKWTTRYIPMCGWQSVLWIRNPETFAEFHLLRKYHDTESLAWNYAKDVVKRYESLTAA